jgi:hypothetical protein
MHLSLVFNFLPSATPLTEYTYREKKIVIALKSRYGAEYLAAADYHLMLELVCWILEYFNSPEAAGDQEVIR